MIIFKQSNKLVCRQIIHQTQNQLGTSAIILGLAYGTISSFFLRNPHYLHKKYDQKNKYLNDILEKGKTVTVAHRGGAHEIAENTIQSFYHANKQGSQILEMDICLTKDEVVVVSHDNDILRVTGNKQKLHSLNYSQINHYLPEVELEFVETKQYLKIKDNQEYFIPKFEEVLQKFRESILCVDLKEPNDVLISKTFDLIEKYQMHSNIILGSQFIKDWEAIKSQNKLDRLFASENHLMKIHVLYLLGLLPFVKLDISLLATPLYTQAYYNWELELSHQKPLRKLAIKLQFMMIRLFNTFNHSLFLHLRKRGVLTFYWTANKQEEMVRALKDEPSGIVTDYPTILQHLLENNNRK